MDSLPGQINQQVSAILSGAGVIPQQQEPLQEDDEDLPFIYSFDGHDHLGLPASSPASLMPVGGPVEPMFLPADHGHEDMDQELLEMAQLAESRSALQVARAVVEIVGARIAEAYSHVQKYLEQRTLRALQRYPQLASAFEYFHVGGKPFYVLMASGVGALFMFVLLSSLLRDPENLGYYRFRKPDSRDNNEPVLVITRDGEFDVAAAARLWDSKVGCAAFRWKHRQTIRKFAKSKEPFKFPKNPSLQDLSKPSCSKMKIRHVTVQLPEFSHSWLEPGKLEGLYVCPRCGITCQLTWQDTMAVSPDAVMSVFPSEPSPDRESGGSHRSPLRAQLNLESWGLDPEHKNFEIGVAFSPQSDVQLSYWDVAHGMTAGRQRNVSQFKRQDALLFRAGSNCQVKWRDDLVTEIFSQIPHHSFGFCQNNVNGTKMETEMYPGCDFGYIGEQRQEVTTCVMSHYKFHLAIENTKEKGYATEKLLGSLTAGTVPIYVGAPDVANLMPPDSFIDGTKYTPSELAQLVTALHQDPVRYMNFFGWKMCGVLGNLEHTIALGFESFPCRLCEKVSAMGGRMYHRRDG